MTLKNLFTWILRELFKKSIIHYQFLLMKYDGDLVLETKSAKKKEIK